MQFLRGRTQGAAPVRPPWSMAEMDFIDRCERCADCEKACPDALIVKGRGGFPEMDFTRGGCTFCGDCLTACRGRALIGDRDDEQAAWNLRAQITSQCLSARGVMCRSCGEACDQGAIKFQLEVGGIARPSLNTDACNGCGECFSVCPVKAVRLLGAEPLQQAE